MVMALANSILTTFLTLGFRILKTFESICYCFQNRRNQFMGLVKQYFSFKWFPMSIFVEFFCNIR